MTQRPRTLAGDLEAAQRAWKRLQDALWAERGTLGAAILISLPAVLILLSYFGII